MSLNSVSVLNTPTIRRREAHPQLLQSDTARLSTGSRRKLRRNRDGGIAFFINSDSIDDEDDDCFYSANNVEDDDGYNHRFHAGSNDAAVADAEHGFRSHDLRLPRLRGPPSSARSRDEHCSIRSSGGGVSADAALRRALLFATMVPLRALSSPAASSLPVTPKPELPAAAAAPAVGDEPTILKLSPASVSSDHLLADVDDDTSKRNEFV